MKETRILLNEITFTNICKAGYITHYSNNYGTIDIHLTKVDIKSLSVGEIVSKETDDEVFKIALQDIGMETIKEIVKRSPMYSGMYYEL